MFYSSEFLTDRQYGVATIWLVATLGSKSNLKKVTRKAITDVNIPKACGTITNPEAPLALRLQANLLYGVSRVHSQQCGYMLTDLHSFKDKMRGIEQIMKELEIDPDVGKTRPEQLNLAEDPAFMPELDLNFDLSIFNIPTDGSRASSVFSSQTMASSRTSLQGDQDDEPYLILPSMDTPGHFDDFGANFGADMNSTVKTASKAGAADLFEESPIIEHPEFEIAEDGSIVVIPDRAEQEHLNSAASDHGASESAISARVRAEHEAGRNEDQIEVGLVGDDPIMFGNEDEVPLPPAQPFSPQLRLIADAAADATQLPASDQPHQPSVQPTKISTTTESAAAPQHRTRPVKALQPDVYAELSNRQLGEWDNNYIANMTGITRRREQAGSIVQARKNAAFWIMEQGIGGVELLFGEERLPHPLAVLSGQNLIDALRGRVGSPAGSKRAHDTDAEDEDQDGRRVRARTEDRDIDDEVGRGVGNPAVFDLDEGIVVIGDDDMPIESEVGRHAQSSLPDHGPSSAMPWNMSGSRQGSAAPNLGSTGFGGAGMSSSARGAPASGLQLGPGMLSRRGSRLTSASPLMGKGISRFRSLGIEDPTRSNLDSDEMPMPMGDEDDFELYGPAAKGLVDTQKAQESQWVRSALEDEANNFLKFLKTQVGERGEELEVGVGDEHEEEARDGHEDGEWKRRSMELKGRVIALETLLPPEKNTKVVGAQGLLHILSLTTKGLVEVEQPEAWKTIWLKVVPHHESVRPEAGEEGDEDEGDEDKGDEDKGDEDEDDEEAGAEGDDEMEDLDEEMDE